MSAMSYEEKCKRAASKVERKVQVDFLESLRAGGKTWKECVKAVGISDVAALGILENRPRLPSPRGKRVKAAKALPKEIRQAILDLIWAGGTSFKAIADQLAIPVDTAVGVFELNLKKVPQLNRTTA